MKRRSRKWFPFAAMLAGPLAVALSGLVMPSEPVEATRYGKACLRIEARGMPWQSQDAPAFPEAEQARAQAGCGARWIQVVDHHGSPLVKNPFLPCPFADAEKNSVMLRQWVDTIHQAGMPVVSWFALSFCGEGAKTHPDWRQVPIVPWPDPALADFVCCINSGYGDALIEYCTWVIERYELDGIWFDGSAWTPIWQHPLPLTCRCSACQTKFKSATGREIPTKVDWQDPVFRQWLAWRYQQFGGYIGRLAGAIRAKHPHAAVVINHYHRPEIPWHSAIPLDRYAADIISGSEAFSPDRLDLTMRLCRAYGRSQSEVWRPFDTSSTPEANAEGLLRHALICYSAGGHPSFGGDPFDPKMSPTAALMSPVMKAIHPYVGGPSVPYAAIHVSQQTETFFFGPVEGLGWGPDPYFDALSVWTEALGQSHVPPDYVYDSDFRSEVLARYRVVLMPVSQAISDAQAAAAVEYAQAGGTLLLGVGAGQLDPQGWPRSANPLGQSLGFAFEGVPKPGESQSQHHLLTAVQDGKAIHVSGMRAPVQLTAPDWKVLYREGAESNGSPAVALRSYGKGHVVVLSLDPTRISGITAVDGGKTELSVTDETAAGGTYSLKFVDDALAPQTFCPDLETRLPALDMPKFKCSQLRLDLKAGKDAHVSIEIRSCRAPIVGPIVSAGPQQKVWTGGQALCDLPVDQWIQLEIECEFASPEKGATYQVTATHPNGQRYRSPRLPCPDAQYCRTDWFVIFGPGTIPTTFYVDNAELAGIRPDGTREVVHRMDFEEGPEALSPPLSLARALAERIKHLAPPPVEVVGPEFVRVGAFEASPGRVLVHLHNRQGACSDWQQSAGPPVTIRCGFPIRSVRLPIANQPLAVREHSGRHEIVVPAVGYYRVLELQR
ncbi:MAG: hypothetical protein A2V98_02450 [Planctomycetes bacterium RBG_16_64_12]|nr:MAG: hypothetical protein A2V98_02450 [Planctomycetes bacterium RBG_16_64_12]